MAESATEGQPQQADAKPKSKLTSTRWLLVRAGCGRVGRWAIFSVVLAAAPILASFFFLPKSSPVTSLLRHGDFAILAAALVAAAMGELFAPDEPVKWIRNVLISSCLMIFTFTIVLLGGIAGNSPQLSPAKDARYSWMSFGFAVLIGIASWALTINRFVIERNAPQSARPSEAGGDLG
jgi:hypothetical protein